jgi:dTDP-4-dehydrorhamnose reductase
MKFAVIGDRGMFGAEMVQLLDTKNLQGQGFNRTSLDLNTSVDEISEQLQEFDVIINAVAYTAVDQAESEPELANQINGFYAGKLAKVARDVGAKFAHISTDYVFDGRATSPYSVSQKANPKSAYGSSKLLGENLVADSGANFTIFRTAWLYGKHGRCFPRVVFKKASEKEALRIVNDQFGQPTWARDLAEQVLSFCELGNLPKIVHAVSSGMATWYEFAKEVVGDYPMAPVSSLDFETPANRPSYSVLDNSSQIVSPIGDWRERWAFAKADVLADV